MARFAQVVVDLSIKEVDRPFDYRVPRHLMEEIAVGHQVQVPFGHRHLSGFVIALKDESSFPKTKDIHSLIHPEPLFTLEMLSLIEWMAHYYQCYLVTAIKSIFPMVVKGSHQTLVELANSQILLPSRAQKQRAILAYLQENEGPVPIKELLHNCGCKTRSPLRRLLEGGMIQLLHEPRYRRPYAREVFLPERPLSLNRDQERAVKAITQALKGGKGETFLLHGVTGSGKTEVYLQAIAWALEQGGGAIALVPEVALTWQTVNRFTRRFGDTVAVLHSYLSPGERFDEWLRIKRGEARVVIGARSAVFAPLPQLSLIVIDEEHEWSYKEGENPRYHATAVARERGRREGVVVVLGSATPDLESRYQADQGQYQLLQLKKRINHLPLPPVKILDMRKELIDGNRTILSHYLYQGIKKRLAQGEQVLLFLNRRGFSNFLLCRRCGYVPRCTHCTVSLTFHAQPDRLYCHYCSHPYPLPSRCPQCGSRYLQHLGIGTQQVEEVVKNEFPGAVVGRMDMDTTRRKGAHDAILKRLAQGELDILVGTQMIAKGHDLPNITLVGVIIADTVLHFPDFRSPERTFQLLTQVAGRTGRGEKGGEVVVQTYSPHHYSIQAAGNHDYTTFYNQELALRKEQDYPPYSRLINMIFSSEEETLCQEEAFRFGALLQEHCKSQGLKQILLLGPSPATLHRIRGQYRWQILLKGPHGEVLRDLNRTLLDEFLPRLPDTVSVRVDIDPVSIL